MTGTTTPLARKLTAFAELNPAELKVLADLQAIRRQFSGGQKMGDQVPHDQTAFVLTDGWACSYKLRSGGTPYIVDVRIPGDFLGMNSILLRTSDHAIRPVTPVTAAEFNRKDILNTLEQAPKLGFALLWSASRDEAMLADHAVSLSRRNAAERTAHFLLELASRLQIVGLGGPAGYDCPLTLFMIADALGLTAIHVSRVMRQLGEAGLVTFEGGRVEFLDFDGLVEFADFDRTYLNHGKPLLC